MDTASMNITKVFLITLITNDQIVCDHIVRPSGETKAAIPAQGLEAARRLISVAGYNHELITVAHGYDSECIQASHIMRLKIIEKYASGVAPADQKVGEIVP